MLVVRATAYQAGLRRLWEQALARLTPDLLKLAQPPVRGRKRYLQAAALAAVIANRIAEAKLDGVVQTELASVALRDGTTAWVLAAVWVDRPPGRRWLIGWAGRCMSRIVSKSIALYDATFRFDRAILPGDTTSPLSHGRSIWDYVSRSCR